MYSFDPVGSYEREACRAAGAAQALVQPFLDNQVSPRRIQRLRCAVVSDVPICSRLAAVIGYLPSRAYSLVGGVRQIYFKNQKAAAGQTHPTHLPLSDVLAIVIDSFTSATERHIEVRSVSSIYPTPSCLFPKHAYMRGSSSAAMCASGKLHHVIEQGLT